MTDLSLIKTMENSSYNEKSDFFVLCQVFECSYVKCV